MRIASSLGKSYHSYNTMNMILQMKCGLSPLESRVPKPHTVHQPIKLPSQVTQQELKMASAEDHPPEVQDFQIRCELEALLGFLVLLLS